MEGAEAIAEDLSNLQDWYDARAAVDRHRLVAPERVCRGVPFEFPASPDTGPGLTEAGRALVRACNELGILVDVSHLNERGFWDVAEVSERPVVATHSNAHALCASTRNLTDAQLDAVRDSGGVVGVNFAVTFLREDGLNDFEETGLDEIVRHVDYLVDRMGIDHVAFGSDFDGADGARGARRRSRFAGAHRCCSASDTTSTTSRITHRNWLRVLDATWR